jgi:Tfp pilus assembly protein PilX
MINNIRNNNKGFTLLIAVLVSSLLLAIGLSLTDFAVKQLIISSAGRESQFAFYAADTGIECAFYWDFKYGSDTAFATTSASLPPSSGIKCNGQDIAASPWTITSNATRATTTFAFNFLPQPYCVIVSIGKWGSTTTIESRGYNVGTVSGSNCTSSNPRRVERAIRVRY